LVFFFFLLLPFSLRVGILGDDAGDVAAEEADDATRDSPPTGEAGMETESPGRGRFWPAIVGEEVFASLGGKGEGFCDDVGLDD